MDKRSWASPSPRRFNSVDLSRKGFVPLYSNKDQTNTGIFISFLRFHQKNGWVLNYSPYVSHLGITLCTLSLAVGGWSDGTRMYLKLGCHNLPPLLSNFATLIFNAVVFPSFCYCSPWTFPPTCAVSMFCSPSHMACIISHILKNKPRKYLMFQKT